MKLLSQCPEQAKRKHYTGLTEVGADMSVT
jgi:hypothetical protein